MIKYHQIQSVLLEISTLCNASCPWCPRNFWGYPYNDGYPEINFTLENAKKVFSTELLTQLTEISISGNFGDIVMNPEGADIVEYFVSTNPALSITISTNGGARDSDFWTRLAKSGATVIFCIDGLSDTHHLYRQNTKWDIVIKNAKTFIAAGGRAVWKMIQFDHNQHQETECQNLSKELGFKHFKLVNHNRNIAPVFNKHKKLTHVLGNYTGEKNFELLFYKRTTDTILLEDIINDRSPAPCIDCQAKNNKFIYISANGEVSPCPWTGFYPKTFGKGYYYQPVNAQLLPLISKNNALEYPLKDCIAWFSEVEKSWDIPTFEEGRLVICNDVCGKSNK